MNSLRLILASTAFSLLTSPAFAKVELQTLQSQLKQEHATWTAHENWVTQLPLDQIKRMMGYPEKVRIDKDISFTEVMGGVGVGPSPSSALDWRNKDGQNWVSPVLNQGNCGSCVAFATVGTLETQMNISRNYPWLNMRYSTDALFACGGGACESGWYPSAAANFLESTGVPDEACAPYSMGATGQDISCSSICSDASSRSQKVSKVNTPRGVQAVKNALKHGPLETTMDVYGDFVYYSSGVYKHTTGDYLGGHAVSIVGFDDTSRSWIVRNSWGADWGDKGFVNISYDDTSGIGDQTWGFEVPNADGVVAIRNLHDNDYLSGVVALDSFSTFAKTSDLSLVVVAADKQQTQMACAADQCSMSLDTTKMADGRYEAFLQANHNGVKSTSDKKYFYVVNKAPDLKLSFSPADNADLSKPIKDRIVFNISAISSSVPFSNLHLQVKQNGKLVYSKGTQLVVPQMTLGWRTPSVPNGTYQISLVGGVESKDIHAVVSSNEFTVTIQN